MSEGKKTLKSVFKSKSKKEESIVKLNEDIEKAQKDVEEYKVLINFVTIYHGLIAIPKFKQSKVKHYMKSLNNFCVKEITNAHFLATLYHDILEAAPSSKKEETKKEDEKKDNVDEDDQN